VRRFWTIVFWATALASVVPILATRFLPFVDLPEHVAAIGTVARLIRGDGGGPSDPYVVDLARSQYFLYHAAGGAIAVVTRDAILANQILLAIVAVLWPVSLRRLLRATGRDERFAIFATMVFYNRALAIGFLPYLASVPIALFALAFVARWCRAPTWRRGVAVSALAVLLFYMHVSSYALFAVIAAIWTLVATRKLRELARLAAMLAPSALGAFMWWRSGSLASAPVPNEHDIGRMSLARSVEALPVWTFDVWTGHGDELAAALWWTAFGVAAFFGLRRARHARPLLFVPVVAAALLYFVTPFRVGNASMLNVRLAPLVVLLALVPLAAARAGAWKKWPLALAAIASIVTTVNTTFEARRASNEMVGDFDGLLASIEPGKRVVMMNYDRRSPRTHFWPYVFAGSYHRALHGGVSSWSFTELPHWPLHYAPGEAPPRHRPFWIFNPRAFRPNVDGKYYDYALVQSDGDSSAPDPRFARVARSGKFTLFAKTNDATEAPQPL
jgi:hypothetical protein